MPNTRVDEHGTWRATVRSAEPDWERRLEDALAEAKERLNHAFAEAKEALLSKNQPHVAHISVVARGSIARVMDMTPECAFAVRLLGIGNNRTRHVFILLFPTIAEGQPLSLQQLCEQLELPEKSVKYALAQLRKICAPRTRGPFSLCGDEDGYVLSQHWDLRDYGFERPENITAVRREKPRD